MNPKLRPIEVRPMVDRDQPALMLRDPQAISDKVVILPQALGPLLALCDGSRDISELGEALLVHAGLRITQDVIQRVIDHLDDALLLENDHFAQAYTEALQAYRAAPFRPPVLAGQSYPGQPAALRAMLEDYLSKVSANGSSPGIVGLVSPHIDYPRGGPVYASAWSQAAEAIRAADLAVIFGTDHSGGAGRITFTRQNYATPYGTLPTDVDVVDAVVAAIGEEAAFAEEIHHRQEHSIELAAVWLHHMRGGQPCRVVPILCGSFHDFVENAAGAQAGDPATDPTFNVALDALRVAIAGQKVVIVAAADLAHIGPAFGGSFPIDRIRYEQLQVSDEILIETITDGDAAAFFSTIAAERDRRNICGLPPIYLTLRLLGSSVRGELTGYDRCPADEQNTSFVSVCGMVLREHQSTT
jgi:AmmeMemoRadiSam system protein B